ncbi:hypothetical protein EPN81_02665 [Patescibacteria group bacterium]|nr:MAG: hypothetical protein EPN81_02665 [Patescibacteria group bacterium]
MMKEKETTGRPVRGGQHAINEKATNNEERSSAMATTFERNEHGHIVIAFTGHDLTGEQEDTWLRWAIGYCVSGAATACFTSAADDSYDKNHRLVAGKPYRVALVPGEEIPREFDRTTAALRNLGKQYGYGKPLAGHIPHVRKIVSDTREMGIQYVVSLHDFIRGDYGFAYVLTMHRNAYGRWVHAYRVSLYTSWNDGGAFLFPIP